MSERGQGGIVVMEELKPCPFCGSKAELTHKSLSEVYGYAVEYTIECSGCHVRFSKSDDQNPKGGYALSGTGRPMVLKSWNNRYSEPKTCDGCRWWVDDDECAHKKNHWIFNQMHKDMFYLKNCGPKFGCIHWERVRDDDIKDFG